MHKVFSLSARSFLQKLRLEAASDLLLRTDLPVGEITGRCGYPDQSAFTRQFRQAVGVTPTEYRRLYRPITGG
jgi:AraC-like DNA-binding protein